MSILNCKRCNRIYKKVLSDFCPECLVIEEERFAKLYRTLQKSASTGGVSIEELAHSVGMETDEIETIYLEGRLGTAGTLLKFQCQTCGIMMTDLKRRGRFCVPCSEKTANKAGVEVKSKQDLERQDNEAIKRQKQMEMLKSNQAARSAKSTGSRRYGFTGGH